VLNVASFADMALRGRPSSQAPAQTVEKIAQGMGRPVPGSGDGRENRLSGLGGPATGALAMAATDLPMARLGVSDPAGRPATDWVSDAVPHLMSGLATYGTLVDHGK
jgi:hypothetical protein